MKGAAMAALIWGGSTLTLLGLGGILWCIRLVVRARREGLEESALRARLQRIVAMNLGALGLSVLGLMAVIAGISLG
jgi:hypothetical protein